MGLSSLLLFSLLFSGVVLQKRPSHEKPVPGFLDVTDDNFEEVINSHPYIFLDFYTNRSELAVPSDPTMTIVSFTVAEKLKHLTQLKFGKIHTSGNPRVSGMIGLKPSVFPHKVLFKNGKIIDIAHLIQKELLHDDNLKLWLEKRVVGPVQKLKSKNIELEESRAMVLVMQKTPSEAIEKASYKLNKLPFYQYTEGCITHNDVHLVEGGVYMIRNFIGEESVIGIDEEEEREEDEAEEEKESGLVKKLRKLSTPVVQEIGQMVMSDVQVDQKWMLGLSLRRSSPSHNGVLEVFTATLQHLTSVMEAEVAGVYLDTDKIRDDIDDTNRRLAEYFDVTDPPAVFLFRFDGEKTHKSKMDGELTDHNIKTFLFAEIQSSFKEKQDDAERAKKLQEMKKSETPPANWREKQIKPLTRSTILEWAKEAGEETLIVLCYSVKDSAVNKALFALNKLHKKLGGKVGFGKINTAANDLDEIVVPEKAGFVRIYARENGRIGGEVLTLTLDTTQLESKLATRTKDEL